jgi:Rps23 Pro-64 3,4-dihydroxylase Tpa1-like proline 4-hydroxylase
MNSRQEIAEFVIERLKQEKSKLAGQFASSKPRCAVIDDVLPVDLATAIYTAFPKSEQMMLKKSLREFKFVTAQMDRCDPLAEEAIYAFQDDRVVALVADITGIREPRPDRELYAGGLSVMGKGHFLNPHIDNSHDRHRQRYRVLNLLYYVSPDWRADNGGSLELWPEGVKGEQVTIPSLFNRLVLMETNRSSWHSVSRIATSAPRCCVSNYYFSMYPPEGSADYFHVTSFRGRPEQPVRDLILRADIALRSAIRRVAKKGLVANPHFYDRRPE